MKPVRAGKLRQRLQLLAPRLQANSPSGDPTLHYDPVDTVWGNVEPLAGRELFLAQQVTADVTHRVTIRYRDDVKASWRIAVQPSGETFELGPPLNTEFRKRELTFTATQKV